MKKTLLMLVPITTMMVLSSCGGSYTVPDPAEPETPEQPFKPDTLPQEILLNSYSETLFVDETFQITPLITPLMASDAALIYSSSNPSVISINESGLATALAEGSSNVTVASKDNLDVKNTIKFRVFNVLSKSDRQLALNIAKMKIYQKNNVSEPDKLKTRQVKTYTWFANGELYKKSVQYNDIAFSTDDAVAYFGGRDTNQRINDGISTRDFGNYIIETDKDYHSFIYHNSDYADRYCYVPTEFNLGTEYSRMDTVYSILDSLFTSGRDLVLNTVEDSLGTSWFDYSRLMSAGAYKDDSELACNFKQSFKDKSTPLMEQNLDIPAYIEYEEKDDFRVYWYKGEVQTYVVNFILTYVINGVTWDLKVQERDTFLRGSDAKIEMPDKSKFDLVDDIFDI